MQLVSVAKLLGVVALLVPGFAKIREWAYAGFCIDLIGAAWCLFSCKGVVPDLAFVAIFMVLLFTSYFMNQKRNASAN
jgi:hypothetical protein